MEQFLVYYGEALVGALFINEQGKYKYICNHDALGKISKSEPIAPALSLSQEEFGDPIPFFKVRLEANKRFENLEVGFVTDKVRIEKIEPQD